MIKVARTEEDFKMAFALAMKFAEASPYSKYTEPGAMQDVLAVSMRKPDSIVFLDSEGQGMILGTIVPFIYGSMQTAVELAWWVNPEARKTGLGRDLMDKFESWARIMGCGAVIMVSLDDDIGNYYVKRGYELRERTYMKEL